MTFVAAVVFACLPLLGAFYALLGFIRSPYKWRSYLPFYVLFFFVLGYAYNTTTTSDLYRYLQMVDDCGRLPFSEVIKYFNDGLYVEHFLFWMAGHLRAPHLLPGLTTSIVYGVTGYITCDSCERNQNTDDILKILIIQILWLPLILIINNIRCVCAFALAVLSVYLHYYKRRKLLIEVILWICGILFHWSTLIILILFLLTPLLKRVKILTVLLVFFLAPLIEFSYTIRERFNVFGSFIGGRIINAIEMAHVYLHDTGYSRWSQMVQTSMTYRLQRYTTMLCTIVFLILILIISRRKYEENNLEYQDRSFSSFAFLIGILVLSCNVITTPQYWRFAVALSISSGQVISKIMYRLKCKRDILLRIMTTALIITILAFFFVIIRETSWQFNFGEYLQNIILSGPLRVIFDMVTSGI